MLTLTTLLNTIRWKSSYGDLDHRVPVPRDRLHSGIEDRATQNEIVGDDAAAGTSAAPEKG